MIDINGTNGASNIVPITGGNIGTNGGGTGTPAMAARANATPQQPHTNAAVILSEIDSALRIDPLTVSDLYDTDRMLSWVDGFLAGLSRAIRLENALRDKGEKWPIPQAMTPPMIAEVLVRIGVFRRMITADHKSVLLLRMTQGLDKGIYKIVTLGGRNDIPTPEAAQLVRAFNPAALTRDICETLRLVTLDMRLKTYDQQHDDTTGRWVWCNNGVYDLQTGEFCDYDDPAFEVKYGDAVRTWKLAVDYNPAMATLPILHNDEDGTDWDVDTQFYDLFDVQLFSEEQKRAYQRAVWEIINFAIRGINGGHAYWLVNTGSSIDGGNGKSCITEILRGLLNPNNVLPTPIEELGDKFALGELPRKAAIISDETDADVNAVERASVYKKLVTNEQVLIEKKNVDSYAYVFRGLMVQSMNSMIKIASAGGSFWRRPLILRFERNFATEGIDRKYIKDDYVNRREVLEAVLFRALQLGMLRHISPDIVAACAPNKLDARGKSSQVWSYMGDIAPLLDTWMDAAIAEYGDDGRNLRLPIRLLYDCYRDPDNGWAVANGYRHPLAFPSFCADLAGWCSANGAVYYDPKSATRVSVRCLQSTPKGSGSNPLLYVYPVDKWLSPQSRMSNSQPKAYWSIVDTHRGVIELRK